MTIQSILTSDPLGQTQQLNPESQIAKNIFFELHMQVGTSVPGSFQLDQAQSNFQYLHRKLDSSPQAMRSAVSMDARIMHGNPVFCGTRISLYRIIEEFADGTNLEQIAQGYPSLTKEKIQIALDFVCSLLRIYDEQIPG